VDQDVWDHWLARALLAVLEVVFLYHHSSYLEKAHSSLVVDIVLVDNHLDIVLVVHQVLMVVHYYVGDHKVHKDQVHILVLDPGCNLDIHVHKEAFLAQEEVQVHLLGSPCTCVEEVPC
jgi:hypothetical protein